MYFSVDTNDEFPGKDVCTAGMFICNSPYGHEHCIFDTQWCDGIVDCGDGRDENQAQCSKCWCGNTFVVESLHEFFSH